MNNKHDRSWFEDRIGQFIFRPPFFKFEEGRPFVAIKVKDKQHARQLFDSQRPGKPLYEDKPRNFSMSRV